MATSPATGSDPSVLRAEDGDAIWAVGALMVVKRDAGQTDGAYTLVDHTAPAGYETPYHVHRNEDELFYILKGQLECLYGEAGENRVRATPHDTVVLPRDVPHGFRVVGERACRMVVQVTPGGLEELFRDVGEPAPRLETPPPSEPDAAALAKAAAAYDLDILGPLPE
jgi:quercetin dioxygenase-like cupin family protein